MKRLFGTDGIRSRAGEVPLDRSTVFAIGRAIGEQIGGRILVGRDPRESSPWIFECLRTGLERGGAVTENAGVLPTPAVALLTQQSDFHGGVMISASHNPFEDNGIKVFGADGQKLGDREEIEIEERIAAWNGAPEDIAGRGAAARIMEPVSPWAEHYMDLLRRPFARGEWLGGLRISVDGANGAMSAVAPALLAELGAEVAPVEVAPSGRNINAGCGAVHPERLLDAVRKDGTDFGVAFDGDGDRAMFVSSDGRIVDGDAVLLVMARLLKKAGRLTPPVVVGTSMTNYSLERFLLQDGIQLVRVDVGDRYVFREMLSIGAQLGGEPSGHIIFSDYRLSGDGLLTTLKLCEAILSEQASLSQLTEDWRAAPQLLESVRVTERRPLETLPSVMAKIKDIGRALEGRGRIVVRYSGTEPLLRVMIESDSDAANRAYAEELIGVIQAALL